MKKKKKKSIGKLKKEAWNLLSKIRRLQEADRDGNCKCVTCGKIMFWKETQAGHFIDGRTNSILFIRMGIWPQCYQCNVMRHGNKVEFYQFMHRNYGEEVINHLREVRNKTEIINRSQYEEMIAEYKKELEVLLNKQ